MVLGAWSLKYILSCCSIFSLGKIIASPRYGQYPDLSDDEEEDQVCADHRLSLPYDPLSLPTIRPVRHPIIITVIIIIVIIIRCPPVLLLSGYSNLLQHHRRHRLQGDILTKSILRSSESSDWLTDSDLVNYKKDRHLHSWSFWS